jgi:hypothetical protein
MTEPSYVEEVDAITATIQHYIEGGKRGSGAVMSKAFHEGASIFGYVGADLFGGPIQGLFDWNDQNGPAPDVKVRISRVDVVGTAANVRLDEDNWTGHRFTVFLNLLKFDGQWKVVSKVFHLHH